MKLAVWGTFAALTLIWTGCAALLAQLIQWVAQGTASAGTGTVGVLTESLSGRITGAVTHAVTVPPWLSPWIDTIGWRALGETATGAMRAAESSLPFLGQAVSWLGPVVWILWGIGIVVMLGLALLGNWSIGRLAR